MSFLRKSVQAYHCRCLSLHQLLFHKCSLFSRFCFLFQKVREEEHLQHKEDDNQLDDYHRPERPAQSHVPESIIIEVKSTINKPFLVHSME